MKKVILFFVLILVAFNNINAQCVPEANIPGYGIYPMQLPDAIVGEFYSTVVSLKVPKDTSIVYSGQTIPVTIDSARVIYINNLPDSSFKSECNRPTCTWAGGATGCTKFSGMPKSTHKRKYQIKVYVNSYLSSPSFPGSQFERIDSSTIDLFIPGGVNSIGELSAALNFTIKPNPAFDKVFIKGLENKANNPYTFSLIDITGNAIKTIDSKLFDDGFELNISDVSKGVYFIKVSNTETLAYRKLVVQ